MAAAQVPNSKPCPLSLRLGDSSPLLDTRSLEMQRSYAAHVPTSVHVHVSLAGGDGNTMQPSIEVEAGDENNLSDAATYTRQPHMSDAIWVTASLSSSQSPLWPLTSYNNDLDIEDDASSDTDSLWTSSYTDDDIEVPIISRMPWKVGLPHQRTSSTERLKSMNSTKSLLSRKSTKSVVFIDSPNHSVHASECSVQPYSEIYGQHPREFVFDARGQRRPTPVPIASRIKNVFGGVFRKSKK